MRWRYCARRADRLPGRRWSQRFDRYVETEYTHDYGELLT
jgi:hypothetical protein